MHVPVLLRWVFELFFELFYLETNEVALVCRSPINIDITHLINCKLESSFPTVTPQLEDHLGTGRVRSLLLVPRDLTAPASFIRQSELLVKPCTVRLLTHTFPGAPAAMSILGPTVLSGVLKSHE